jgi:3-oxoacyl-[acyl-carrier-protein] synthase III
VNVRLIAQSTYLPGEKILLESLSLGPAERRRLKALCQQYTYVSAQDSTELMLRASEAALSELRLKRPQFAHVISAPSLITAYGLEIPAVALRAKMQLDCAQCLNIAQGCIGILRGIELAARLISGETSGSAALVATSCRASALTENLSHGSFFWGDAGAAAVLVNGAESGFEIAHYAESSADEGFGSMRIDFGDSVVTQQSQKIRIAFDTPDAQIEYVRGEQRRMASVVDALLAARDIRQGDVSAVVLPSTGKNRLPSLFSEHRELLPRVVTDFRCAHLGGVDVLLSLQQWLASGAAKDGAWVILLSPAFTVQWGGLLLRYHV